MQRIKFQFISLLPVFTLLIWMFFAPPQADVLAQESQPSSTPVASQSGIFITVLEDGANVRVGPSTSNYLVIGRLEPGETAPAIGRSPGGDWIQIEYPGAPNGGRGWVYAGFVLLSPGTLQIAEPPPTSIPPATSTIDPTLAAQFLIVPTGTRLPTFTAPAPLSTLMYTAASDASDSSSIPMAIVILSLAGFGVVGFILSVLLPRRSFS